MKLAGGTRHEKKSSNFPHQRSFKKPIEPWRPVACVQSMCASMLFFYVHNLVDMTFLEQRFACEPYGCGLIVTFNVHTLVGRPMRNCWSGLVIVCRWCFSRKWVVLVGVVEWHGNDCGLQVGFQQSVKFSLRIGVRMVLFWVCTGPSLSSSLEYEHSAATPLQQT